MFGHYRNTGIRRLNNYAEALDQFNNTKPIRGRTDPSKPMHPLGHRHRVDSFHIKLCPLTQDVECWLYRTPVVTFKPNGEVVIKSDGWDTISTANFIGEVLGGTYAYIFDHNLCLQIWNEGESKHYRVPTKGQLTLKRGESGRWEYVSGAPETYTHKVNRKAINALRKKYADFKKYAIAMIKLRGNERVSNDELDAVGIGRFDAEYTAVAGYTWRFDTFAHTVRAVHHWINAEGDTKHEQFYKAFVVFSASYGRWGAMTPAEFEAGFNQFTLGVHRDEALTAEPVPLGKVKRDNYGKYWGKAWGACHNTKPEGFELGSN